MRWTDPFEISGRRAIEERSSRSPPKRTWRKSHRSRSRRPGGAFRTLRTSKSTEQSGHPSDHERRSSCNLPGCSRCGGARRGQRSAGTATNKATSRGCRDPGPGNFQKRRSIQLRAGQLRRRHLSKYSIRTEASSACTPRHTRGCSQIRGQPQRVTPSLPTPRRPQHRKLRQTRSPLRRRIAPTAGAFVVSVTLPRPGRVHKFDSRHSHMHYIRTSPPLLRPLPVPSHR